jgi:hypothetical protein
LSATVFFESTSELATIRNVFKVDGVATDPSTISLTITDPTGAATTYTYGAAQITRNSAGDYQKDIACSTAGTWTYQWTGTGTATDVQAGTWEVFPTAVGHLYATVDGLKSRLGLTDAVDDLELHGACFAASRWVEQFCQRVFYRSASATVRTFIPQTAYRLPMPEFNDLVSVSALATDVSGDGTYETTWAAGDYQLWPSNSAGPETQPYTQINAVGSQTFPSPTKGARHDVVQVTGVYGWPQVPQAVREGTLIKAAEIFKLKDAPFGVMGGDDFGFIRIRENQPAQYLLAPYRRFPYLAA